MHDLWAAVGELAMAIHKDRIDSIAAAIRQLKGVGDFARAESAFGPNADRELIARLRESWAAAPRVLPAEIAAALMSASRVVTAVEDRGGVELVWTGPSTGQIATRRTEQVMLEVIGAAKRQMFLVTYVFYKASTIVAGLNEAVARGADVNILLESSIEDGGTTRGDAAGAIADAVPGASIYAWDAHARTSNTDAAPGSVHAKCAVADDALAFITSANLTPAALERNMELGVLIRGGDVPKRLRAHLEALVATRIVRRRR